MPLTEAEAEACEWYLRALTDFRDAKHLREDEPDSPNVIWLAQQAAEKGIKSLLILHQIPFPRSHYLELLRDLLPAGSKLRSYPPDLSALTQYATGSRYPGEFADEHLIDAGVVSLVIELAEQTIASLVIDFDADLLAAYKQSAEP